MRLILLWGLWNYLCILCCLLLSLGECWIILRDKEDRPGRMSGLVRLSLGSCSLWSRPWHILSIHGRCRSGWRCGALLLLGLWKLYRDRCTDEDAFFDRNGCHELQDKRLEFLWFSKGITFFSRGNCQDVVGLQRVSFWEETPDASWPVVHSRFQVIFFSSLDPLVKLPQDIPGTFGLFSKVIFFLHFEIIGNLWLNTINHHIKVIILQDIPILQNDHLILILPKTQPRQWQYNRLFIIL